MKPVFAAFLAATFGASVGSAWGQSTSASANMIGRDGVAVGTVTFNATRSGMLQVILELNDIPPGPHGFHVHETGECSVDDGFESAGGHYAGGKSHGVQDDDGPHPGDFPNVHATADGVVKVEFLTDRLSLDGGDNPLMDEDGSAVVVHAQPDDYASQPSGDAGERIACGVITR